MEDKIPTAGIETKALDLVDQLLTMDNLLAVAGVYIVVATLCRIFPSFWSKKAVDNVRLLPALPMILGVVTEFAPGLHDPKAGTGTIVLTGLLIGFCSSQVHGILKRWVGVKLDDISTPHDESKEETKDDKTPADPPKV